jgi:hypothetical protein
MRLSTLLLSSACLASAACTGNAPQQNDAENSAAIPAPDQNAPAPVLPVNDAAPASSTGGATPAAPGAAGGLPDDRTPLPEPKGPIDAKSAEAAGQAMQRYGALIEEKRFAAAEKLWGDPARAKGYSAMLRANREVHLQVGKPGSSEGAAGSIYINVPIVLYGVDGGGRKFSRSGEATLRRVNDVPGSSAEQRRWHIESITTIQ